MYILTLRNYIGTKNFENLDDVFKTIRKVLKNSKDGEIINFSLVRK